MYTDPIAYFLTWTCYGTWLPGDQRGWTKWRKGERIPQPLLEDWCRNRMKGPAITLNETQRSIVENTIHDHCQLRKWLLHAVNCRTNHCHCVVTAHSIDGEAVRDQFKSWCTRMLNEQAGSLKLDSTPSPKKWWTKKGSVRYIFDDESLEATTLYTLEAQDLGGSNLLGD
jgi:REP element-mobilizing transposase RayT